MKRLIPVFLLIPVLFFSLLTQPQGPSWSVYFSPKGGCTKAFIRELDIGKTSTWKQEFDTRNHLERNWDLEIHGSAKIKGYDKRT